MTMVVEARDEAETAGARHPGEITIAEGPQWQEGEMT